MIRANELRIGNWVYSVIVEETKCGQLWGCTPLQFDYKRSLMDLEPIPLTPEILLQLDKEPYDYQEDKKTYDFPGLSCFMER